jgi:hypothetical protein
MVSLPREKSYYDWGIADLTSHEGFDGMVSFPREKSYYEWGIADFTSHEGFPVWFHFLVRSRTMCGESQILLLTRDFQYGFISS